MKKTINYLNNRDLINEIIKSKNTYCSFVNPADKVFDFIVSSVDDVLPSIEDARVARAKRLLYETPEDKTIAEKAKEIEDSDIVFRVMVNDHIPRIYVQEEDTLTKKASKQNNGSKKNKNLFNDLFSIADDSSEQGADTEISLEIDLDLAAAVNNRRRADKDTPLPLADESSNDPADESTDESMLVDNDDDDVVDDIELDSKQLRVNFPPFQHYRTINNELVCVGKSHWKGSLESGEFCQEHGRVTEELAKMYMMLVFKYSSRSNWRNYTYVEEMRSHALTHLCYAGLSFNESKSSNPFAYLTMLVHNAFLRVLSVEKRVQSIKDDILEINDMTPSLGRQLSETKIRD